MLKRWCLGMIGVCAVISVSGCGGDPQGDQGGTAGNARFAPGGKEVDANASRVSGEKNSKTREPSAQPSRFDLPVTPSQPPAGASGWPENPSAGIGLGDVIGVTDYWDSQGSQWRQTAEVEFETLRQAPDCLPPTLWEVKPDPPAAVPTFAPQKKNQRVEIPLGSQPTNESDNAFALAPSGVVAVGQNAAKRDKREVWDLMTSQKIGTIPGFGVATTMNAISPDGHYFAGVGSPNMFEKTVGIWDVIERGPAGKIPLGRVPFFEGIAIPRNDLLVTMDRETIGAWKLPGGEAAFEIKPTQPVKSETAAFSPGGHYLAVLGRTQEHWETVISFYELQTGQLEGELELPEYDLGFATRLSVRGMAFSPDGTEFAVIADTRQCSKLLIWSLADGSIVDHMTFKKTLKEEAFGDAPFASHKKAEPLVFFPGGRRLLVYEIGILDREVGAGVWRLPGGELRDAFPGNRRPLDEHHVTMLTRAGRAGVIQVFELPEDKIKESAEAMKKIVQAEPAVPSSLLQPGATTDVTSLGGKPVIPQDVPWAVRPDPAPQATASGRAFELAVPRGTIRQVGVSSHGDARVVVLRSRANIPWSRIPSGNTSPSQLRSYRWHAKPSAAEGMSAAGVTSKPRSWGDVYDLADGKRLRELRLTYDGDLVSVSPDGTAFLILAAGDAGRLDLYKTDDGSHLMSWQPYHDRSGELDALVVSAMMPDASHVITLSGAGELCAWEVPTGKAIFTAENISQPACSAGGTYCSFTDGQAYYFVEIATGEVRGRIPDVGDIQAAAFHSDGDRLALLSSHKAGYYLFVVKMSTGEISAPFPVPIISAHMRWFGDRYVLLDNQKLIDVEQKAVAWSYNLSAGDHVPVGPANRHVFVANINGKPVFTLAEIPDSRAAAALAGKTLASEFVLKPGDSCSLSFDIKHPAFDDAARQAVDKQVRSQLAENRITIADGQKVKLEISVSETVGETTEVEFRKFGALSGGETEKVSFPSKMTIFRAAFLINDQEAWTWNSSQSYYTSMVSTKEGETIAQAMAREYTSAVPGGFFSLKLPPYVFTPTSANGIGTTQLGPTPAK